MIWEIKDTKYVMPCCSQMEGGVGDTLTLADPALSHAHPLQARVVPVARLSTAMGRLRALPSRTQFGEETRYLKQAKQNKTKIQ